MHNAQCIIFFVKKKLISIRFMNYFYYLCENEKIRKNETTTTSKYQE
jgi:hypothetical protein